MKPGLHCFIILFSIANGYSQETTFPEFKKLGRPEKGWVVSHPFVARKAQAITQEVTETTLQLSKEAILDGDGAGGQLDAFRHAYWMALLTQKMQSRKALKLGMAHERRNYLDFKMGRLEEDVAPDSVSSVMDMENNEIGVTIGQQNKDADKEMLEKIIIVKILAGELKVIKKDKQGNYLDCDGNRIDMLKWNGKWNIPKCLVSSDYKRL